MASLFLPPLPVGGAERHGLRLARALQLHGGHVTYATARLPGHDRTEIIDGVQIVRLQCFPWVNKMRNSLAVHVYWMSLAAYAIRQANYDVLFSQGAFDISSVGMVLAARGLSKKSVVRYASDDEYARLNKFVGGRLLEHVVRRADAHIANGPSVYSMMVTTYGLPIDKCGIIANGVIVPEHVECSFRAHERLNLPHSSRLVVSVGSFYENKCQDRLISAWPRIRQAHGDAHLVLVGSGPLLPQCRALADQLEVRDWVHFVGYAADVEAFLGSATAFVSASISEGCSNALLEAMAHGLPCVAADIAANRAVVTDGCNGLLCGPTDAGDLADKLLEVLGNRARASLMGAEARLTMQQQFSFEIAASRYLDAFSHLVGN